MKPILDISEWQAGLDYPTLANQLSGVILRCGATGYGYSHTVFEDSRFEQHYQGFASTGIPIGIYFYAGACDQAKLEEEIALCKRVLSGKKITLPVYYDMEESNGDYGRLNRDIRTKLAVDFCNGIRDAGYKPGVYTYLSWAGSMVDMRAFDASVSVWMAQYYSECQYRDRHELWQYTSDGSLSGGNGQRLDLSHVIDEAWFNSLAGTATTGPDPIETHEPTKEYIDMQIQVLRLGDEGNLVKALQGILQANGFDLEYCGGCDGIFGEGTEYAVKCYQRIHGLDIDGIVGQETWGSMLSN